jgi:hypothetical protein
MFAGLIFRKVWGVELRRIHMTCSTQQADTDHDEHVVVGLSSRHHVRLSFGKCLSFLAKTLAAVLCPVHGEGENESFATRLRKPLLLQ